MVVLLLLLLLTLTMDDQIYSGRDWWIEEKTVQLELLASVYQNSWDSYAFAVKQFIEQHRDHYYCPLVLLRVADPTGAVGNR